MPGAVWNWTDPTLPSQSPQSRGKDKGQAEQGYSGEVRALGPKRWGLTQPRVGPGPNLCCAQQGHPHHPHLTHKDTQERRVTTPGYTAGKWQCQTADSGPHISRVVPLAPSFSCPACGSEPQKSQAEQREQLVLGLKGHVACQAQGELDVGSWNRGLEHVPPAPEPGLWISGPIQQEREPTVQGKPSGGSGPLPYS